MRYLAKTILTIVFIPLFLVFLVVTTFRFQILNSNFWIETLNSQGVYENIEVVLKKEVSKQYQGMEGEFILTLFTKENIKVTLEENIINLTSFLNGKSEKINIYLPLNKLPPIMKGSIPISDNKITLTNLLALSGRQDILNQIPLEKLSNVGVFLTVVWLIIMALLGAMLFSIYKLVKSGQKFIFPGITLSLSGLTAFAIVATATVFKKSMTTNLVSSGETSTVILGAIADPGITLILELWTYIATGVLLFGIIHFFFKK